MKSRVNAFLPQILKADHVCQNFFVRVHFLGGTKIRSTLEKIKWRRNTSKKKKKSQIIAYTLKILFI